MEGLECKNWGEMLIADTIFGRWELAVADNAHIRNGSNIGVQTFKVHRFTIPIMISIWLTNSTVQLVIKSIIVK